MKNNAEKNDCENEKINRCRKKAHSCERNDHEKKKIKRK